VVGQLVTATKQPWVEAVADVSFELQEAKTFALVGESGSGKTTLGRALIGLILRPADASGSAAATGRADPRQRGSAGAGKWR
jgi:ABC-type oligopeptide transport system ATPase subunit